MFWSCKRCWRRCLGRAVSSADMGRAMPAPTTMMMVYDGDCHMMIPMVGAGIARPMPADDIVIGGA